MAASDDTPPFSAKRPVLRLAACAVHGRTTNWPCPPSRTRCSCRRPRGRPLQSRRSWQLRRLRPPATATTTTMDDDMLDAAMDAAAAAAEEQPEDQPSATAVEDGLEAEPKAAAATAGAAGAEDWQGGHGRRRRGRHRGDGTEPAATYPQPGVGRSSSGCRLGGDDSDSDDDEQQPPRRSRTYAAGTA